MKVEITGRSYIHWAICVEELPTLLCPKSYHRRLVLKEQIADSRLISRRVRKKKEVRMSGAGIEIDYRELVLELLELVREGKASESMLELRLSLFVAAILSERHDQCLLPFPPCFFNRATKAKDFAALRSNIDLIPALKKLDGDCELPALVWNLLYWVFTNPLNISPISNKVGQAKISQIIKEKTGLILPFGADASIYYVFEVATPYPKPAFVEARMKHGSYFAFHGSPLCNFHSIIHRGMLSSLNRRSAFGVGTYFSSSPTTSDEYALSGIGWDKSLFGRKMRCMAICEIVNAPQGEGGLKKFERPLHGIIGLPSAPRPPGENQLPPPTTITISVVSNDDLIQLTYLLVFPLFG